MSKYQELLNKYIGEIIDVKKETVVTKICGESIDIDHYTSEDPKLKLIEKEFSDLGFVVRILLPNTGGTADYRTDRVNFLIANTNQNYIVSQIYIG